MTDTEMKELPSGWNMPPGVFAHMIPGMRPGDVEDEEWIPDQWDDRWSEVADLFIEETISVDDAIAIVEEALKARRAK